MRRGGGQRAPGLSILGLSYEVGTEVILSALAARPHEQLLTLVLPLPATSGSGRLGSRIS